MILKQKTEMFQRKKLTHHHMQRGKRVTVADLPSEIVWDIACRLPAEDLLQFKVVCKRWCNVATEIQFINNIILAPDNLFNQPPSISWTYEKQHIRICRELQLPLRFSSGFSCSNTILGSSNGLLCIGPRYHHGNDTNSVSLCNPITREWVRLPRQNYGREYTKLIYGFGFDSISKKYKVVCVYHQFYWNTCHRVQNFVTMGMIITVGVDNSWRKLLFPYNVELHNATHATFYDGAFYWLIEYDPRKPSSKQILALDINTEKFSALQFTNSVKLPVPSDSYLVNFAESLAIVESHRRDDHFHIWEIFGSRKNSQRWVKHYIVSIPHGICEGYIRVILGKQGNGKLLVQVTEDHEWGPIPVPPRRDHLVIYNEKEKYSSMLKMSCAPRTFNAHIIAPTLVSPKSICFTDNRRR